MHALLSLVATHYLLNRPQEGALVFAESAYHETILHQVQAIEDINNRLRTMESYMDDTLIGAIALLTNCEVSATYLSLFRFTKANISIDYERDFSNFYNAHVWIETSGRAARRDSRFQR
jgi:hypothetical protein